MNAAAPSTDTAAERFARWQSLRPPQRPALPPALCARIGAVPVEALDEALDTLNVLDALQVDADTLAAALWYDLLAAGAPADAWPGAEALQILVDGQRAAETVWSIHAERGPGHGAEGLRRLLLAIIKDLRVALVLLARQLVRLRRATRLDDAHRRALAQLTADIHAPLANRLGVWQVKWEMEDLTFRFLHPDTYKRIAGLLDEKRGAREAFIEAAKRRLRDALAEAGIRADVAGRPTHIVSIWKKMQRQDLPFSELYDIRAVRVLVDDVGACYAALGVVHGLWSPIPSEFDDYIANPKGNNYRSLHTAVTGPEGKTLEVQIRTHEMHEHAELGVAAHWRYKEGGSGDADFERKIAWMRQLLDASDSREPEDDSALLAGLRTDLIEDRIYLLTPRGAVIDLPRGATVLDFAYHVHTEVGHRCRGAKVNGRIVPLDFQPATGDRVEILTGKTAEPRRDWLLAANGYLASARARNKVRAWFHRLDHARNVAAGRELLERELKRLALAQTDLAPVLARLRLGSLDELYVAVALGDVGPGQVARLLHEQSAPRPEPVKPPPVRPGTRVEGFVIEGVGNLLTQLARCCQPVGGEPIGGYLTRGRGVTIHRRDCEAFQRMAALHPERAVQVDWGRGGRQAYVVDVQVRGLDRKWLLKDITNIVAAANVHVLSTHARVDESGGARLDFTLKVSDFEQLGGLLARLHAVPGVQQARRVH